MRNGRKLNKKGDPMKKSKKQIKTVIMEIVLIEPCPVCQGKGKLIFPIEKCRTEKKGKKK